MAKVTVQYLPDYTYSQLLTADRHAFVADEPVDIQGDDLGPSPYELLLWALGACTAITLLMYARRKGLDLQDVSVHLTHERRHDQDCADCEQDEKGFIEVIKRNISVRGELTEEQRAKLLEIAGKCPVHKTLRARPRIVDTLIAGE